MTAATREAWLLELVEKLRPLYNGELPAAVRISTGFTSKGARSTRIGECWHPDAAADKIPHIFVHPGISDTAEVAAIVAHELIHACRPEAKHGAKFKKMALAIGLEGKMTATVPGARFAEAAGPILDEIGAYPHARLAPLGVGSNGPKQSTRMIKCECSECGYTVRTTRKWLDVAVPACPACQVEMVAS